MEIYGDAYQHQEQTQQESQENMQSTLIRRLSNAERQRKFRENKKAAMKTFKLTHYLHVQQQLEQSDDCEINYNETNDDTTNDGETNDGETNKRLPLTNAERQRKYRQSLRKRKQMENINAIKPHNVDPAEQARKLHLNRLRQRRYRERQRYEWYRSPSTHQAQPESGAMTQLRPQSVHELDKLRRRLIRSVARLIKEKKTEDEVWEELSKECGKNCKTLWVRMKSLTLKKLKRLLEAEDCNDAVPSIARMTLTDWLLYDLVLVHEKIDVIDTASTKESEVLKTLFALVQHHNIEGLSGDQLAEAWTAATVDYNSQGRQCSPMLMQRRWYQLKEMTRMKLYQFWFKYRGNKTLLETAKQDPPTSLQQAVALRYPAIIIRQFPTWEESIEKKLIIMPEEFEIKISKKDVAKQNLAINLSEEAAPDVEIVEQKIDTITLDSDSDHDEVNDETSSVLDANHSQTPIIVQIKIEPDIDITEHPPCPMKPEDRLQDAIDRIEIEENHLIMGHDLQSSELTSQIESNMMPLITHVTGATENIKNNLETTNISADLINSSNVISKTEVHNSQQSILIDDEDDDILPLAKIDQSSYNIPNVSQVASNAIDITSPTKEVVIENNDKKELISQNLHVSESLAEFNNEMLTPIITAISCGSPVEAKMEGISNTDEIIEESTTDYNLDLGNDNMMEMKFDDDGIEFVDDGIEFEEEHKDQNNDNETPEISAEDSDENEMSSTPKFDLKLLMKPVTYTTKLDDMAAYKGRLLSARIVGKDLLDKISLESKPISDKTVTVDQSDLTNLGIEETNDIIEQSDDESQEFDDDFYKNQSSNESDTLLEDSKKVKLSSSLLQKPRSRSYNPIQLCKNPDFNTRLKRLTVGFFSSERNRVFLKACKPMTIDLSKAFESKLINGTMYLKPSDPVNNHEVKDTSESAASVMPSAVAVQSLMDTTDVDKILQAELQRRAMERNKMITLPNISLVRQINGQLLMAEVAPLVSHVDKPPHVINNVLNTNSFDQGNSLNANAINEIRNDISTHSTIPTSHVNDIPNKISITSAQTVLNTNKEIPRETIDINNPILPMLNNDKTNENRPQDQQQKKQVRPNNRPLWSTKMIYEGTGYSDSLLTLDTLYKVLNALDSRVTYKQTKKVCNRTVHPRPARTPGPPPGHIVVATDSNKQIQESLTPSQIIPPPLTPITKPKTIRARVKNQTTCCWARSRLNKVNRVINAREIKHKCPEQCKCCCKEILRQTEIDNEIKLLEQLQSVDKFDQTIEEVIQQSRDISNANSEPGAKRAVKRKKPNRNLKPNTGRKKINNTEIADSVHSVDDSTFDDLAADNVETVIENTLPAIETISEVTIDLDNDEISEPQVPTPKIRVYSGNSSSGDHLLNTPKRVTMTPPPPLAPITPTTGLSKVRSNTTNATPVISSKELNENVSLTCTCQTEGNAEQTLAVGGSNVCPIHLKPRVSKETKIYLNRKHMSAQSLFYVGPNKILLTNVSLSSTAEPTTPAPLVQASHHTITPSTQTLPTPPSLPKTLPLAIASSVGMSSSLSSLPVGLPDGVQVIWLPDGTLSYIVDPDVKLSREDARTTLPRILNAVKTQVKASGVTLPKNVPISETTPSDKSKNVIAKDFEENTELSKQNTSIQNSSEEIISKKPDVMENIPQSVDFVNSEVELVNKVYQEPSTENDNTLKQSLIEKSVEISGNENNEKKCDLDVNTNSLASAKFVENIDNSDAVINTTPENLEHNLNHHSNSESAINIAENKKNIATSSSRNLLSDLMEMSGILEEDVTPSQPPSSTLEDSQSPVDANIEGIPAVNTENCLSILTNTSKPIVTAMINNKVCTLNPVTTFNELKYSCKNQGLFFKLDIISGELVPINVCIQKTTDVKNNVKNVKPSDVIDLTDEQTSATDNSEIQSVTNLQPDTNLQYVPTLQTVRCIKPINPQINSKQIKKHSFIRIKPKIQNNLPNNLLKDINTKKINNLISQQLAQMEVPNFHKQEMENKKKELIKRLSNNLKPLKHLQITTHGINILKKCQEKVSKTPLLKRITNLKRDFEIQNNLEDSDVSMEEEYLSDESSEDSDDEPLAKIAKKMKPNENVASTIEQSREIGEDAEMVFERVDFEDDIEAVSSVELPVRKDSVHEEPVPTQLVLSGAAVEQTLPGIIDNLVATNEDDVQDDCILGV